MSYVQCQDSWLTQQVDDSLALYLYTRVVRPSTHYQYAKLTNYNLLTHKVQQRIDTQSATTY